MTTTSSGIDHTRRRIAVTATTAMGLGALGWTGSVLAQQYPSKPIRWLVPNNPGGGADTTARLYAAEMEKSLKQGFVIENRPGGAGIIALNALLQAPADGYMVCSTNETIAVNPFLLEKVPYVLDDFVGVSVMTKATLALVSRTDLPIKSIPDALAYIKTNNGKLAYGSWGVGSAAHLAMEDLLDRIGATMVHAPFPGAMPSINAMLGGQLDIMLTDLGTSSQFIRAGKLKLWAVGTKDRFPSFADTPTLTETVLPGFDWFSPSAMIVKRGTPKEAVQRLHAAIVATGNNPEFRRSWLERGYTPWNSTPEEVDKMLKDIVTASSTIIKKRNIKLT